MSRILLAFTVAGTVAGLAATPALAVRHVVSLAGVVGGEAADQRYEFGGDFLQTHYGLTTAPGGTYLPPLERAVAEARTPGSGRTRGFHRPTGATGLPVADGGTGVTQALTNVGSMARTAGVGTLATDVTRAWIDDRLVGFTLSRVGTTLTYRMANGSPGQADDVWSFTAASIAEINAIQFRLRSAGQNSVRLSDVVFTRFDGREYALGCTSPTNCGRGITGAIAASAGDVHISLFDRISGDFTLKGNWQFDLSPSRAGNNAQIKLLSVPVAGVPEPSSWAMLIAGFGLTGASLRRRRAAIA